MIVSIKTTSYVPNCYNGLQRVHLTQSLCKSLDAFKMLSLQQILQRQRQSTFVNRQETIRRLLEEAAAIAHPTPGSRRQICFLSEDATMRRKFHVCQIGLLEAIMVSGVSENPSKLATSHQKMYIIVYCWLIYLSLNWLWGPKDLFSCIAKTILTFLLTPCSTAVRFGQSKVRQKKTSNIVSRGKYM